MRQYCSVCKAHLDMEVVSDTNEDGVIWLKCPRCKGILPHMEESGDEPVSTEESSTSTPVDELDISNARAYEASSTYEVGDVIHHRGWDDYGLVLAKEQLPGNRSVIRVRFVESGELQLIEGAD